MANRSSSNLLASYASLDNFSRLIQDHLITPPMYNLIFRNKQGLIYNADIIPFSKNIWNENPMQFCLEQYSNKDFFPIILICNDLGSLYQFRLENLPFGIISPLESTILKILDTIIPKVERY